ncbi:MAG: hypothetical protein LH606_09610 [Cytophagaceae bacterium]|nr:hypothetical protein [Cytophagaceae bacterium]
MHTRSLTATFIAFSLLIACTGKDSQDEATLKEAGEIHLQAATIQESLESRMDSLAALKSQLTLLKTPGASAAAFAIDSVTKRFEDWEENLVEVPGLAHKHDNAEGEKHHHHDHKPAPDVTASEMLDIQNELKTNIGQISADAKTALKNGRRAL